MEARAAIDMGSEAKDNPAAATAERSAGLSRVTTTISRSAEYAVAIALVAVCLIVGGAAWFLKYREDQQQPVPISEETVTATPAEGTDEAAPVQWQKELQGKVAAIEEQRRSAIEKAEADKRHAIEVQQQQQQEKQAALLAQQQREAAEAEARRKADAERAAATRLAAAAPAAAAPSAAAPRSGIVNAKLDWKSCSQPKYPALSLQRQEEGTVVIVFDVDAAGKVTASHVDKSSGSTRLDQAAVAGLSKCSFAPATSDGTPTASKAMVRFVWKLDG